MTQKKIERNALIISTLVNIVMTCAGLWVFLSTGIQALFLDFSFSLIGVLSTITAIIISIVSKKKTKHYPRGLYFLEPLYAIFKSLLTLFLLTITVGSTALSAYLYFTKGIGGVMIIGPVFPYALIMTLLCFGLGFFNHYQNKKINGVSTILTAESKSNFIDGILSLGIGVAIVPLSLVPLESSLGFLHYTADFFITATLVLFSIKEPIRVLTTSFRELSGGNSSDTTLHQNISRCITEQLGGLTSPYHLDIFKIGMLVHVQIQIAPADLYNKEIQPIKERLQTTLQQTYENIEITFIF